MNDFTKDELEKILACINESYRGCCVDPDIHMETRNKIQSLIDNYCEHDYIEKNVYLCHKCKVNTDE